MMSFFKINKSRGQGFSLIELMIVVAIVGILAAIALPAYNSSVLRGKRAEGRALVMDAASKMEKHYGDCFGFGTAIATARNCGANQVNLCGANNFVVPGIGSVGCPSETGKYAVTIRAGSTALQYVLDANPDPVQMIDPACNILSVMSNGDKCITPTGIAEICSNTSAATAAAVDVCWGR